MHRHVRNCLACHSVNTYYVEVGKEQSVPNGIMDHGSTQENEPQEHQSVSYPRCLKVIYVLGIAAIATRSSVSSLSDVAALPAPVAKAKCMTTRASTLQLKEVFLPA